MDSDQEDFVFFGTPIEREEEISSRKRKAIAGASGQLRTLPTWKQEVTDEEGRRRFHGAFTGGFSAGYYNTVGSKEGWTPQSFTSSRKNRAEVKQQSIYSFLDEDEKAELEGHSLGTSSQFDTFGFTAVELARKQVEKEQKHRPSAIPGPVPDEILPVTESIGVKLLLKMGWRHGRSIKDSHADLRYDARREARKALLAFSSEDKKEKCNNSNQEADDTGSCIEEPAVDDFQPAKSTPVSVLNPKQDLHGLGFDPYKHAPEFREKKRSRMSGNGGLGYKNSLADKNNLFGFKSSRVAPGFGIGALEELDVEDEDIYAPGYDFVETYTEEMDEPPKMGKEGTQKLITYEKCGLLGFRLASNTGYQYERYEPPAIPKDFVPCHRFTGPLKSDMKFSDSPPPEVPPPEDHNQKVLIEGFATLVARCGKLFEDLSREKNQSNPLFRFLSGGEGHDYYERKLWEEQQKRNDQSKQHFDVKLSPSLQKMTAENRGKILGEKPLERSFKGPSSSSAANSQSSLSDPSAKQASFSELLEAKPFKDDPAKQERFEQFLKEKYKGGLRSTESNRANSMSEAARARERLDFEAAIETLEKGILQKDSKLSAQQFVDFSLGGTMHFTSGGIEQSKDNEAVESITKKMYPKREEFQWRPSALLCRRFDLMDPYMGKPPPAPRLRSKMESKIDSLVFMSDSAKATKVEETAATHRDLALMPSGDARVTSENVTVEEAEVEVAVENVERPVDLYKAIFSDDSGDENEMETSNLNKVEDPEKKNEAANTALSRLIAGDFLESLGKELGLEVPPDTTYATNVSKIPEPDAKTGKPSGNQLTSPQNAQSESLMEPGVQNTVEIRQEDEPIKTERDSDNRVKYSGKYKDDGLSEDESGQDNRGRKAREGKKVKSISSHHRNHGSSSSDDERSRKRSRRRRYRSSDSSSDSSSDHRGRYHSRSKEKRKESSREKSRSRKHSKHHKHRSRQSPSRSHGSEKESREAKKEKRKHRD